jgi:proton-dependent oligopeptide transporter, POT family
LSLRERLEEVRRGFRPAFWVANGTELFERLAYYGTQAALAIYLSEELHFSKQATGWLMGIFGFVVWFLPVLGGTLADRFGFRRSLMFAYLIMTAGYFLLGSLSAPWLAPVRHAIPLEWLVLIVLMIPAMGPSVVKPCVAGTTARASTEGVRSLGYSIYYTLVNVGGTLGPIVAFLVRRSFGIHNVFRVCALSVFLMFFAVLFFFEEPVRPDEKQVTSVGEALRNLVRVLANGRFVLFLVIFSGFWIVFWQEFISVPLFIRGYVNPRANVDLLLSTDAFTVICFQIATSYATRRIRVFPAMTLGILVSSLAWLILFAHPSTPALIATLVVVALGEMIQSPRFYEYVSRLAPPGQQGLYMGYAFLPIAIGYFIAGPLGGYLVHHYGDVVRRPREMWLVITAIGLLTAFLMWLYDRIFAPGGQVASDEGTEVP